MYMNTTHEIYGQGFRDAVKAVSKFGLRTIVLDHILEKRCLATDRRIIPCFIALLK